jgi:hypothetical protein
MTKTASIFLILAVAGTLYAQVRMRAGQWENTVISNGRSAIHNSCVTPEQDAATQGTPAAMRDAIEKSLAKTGSCVLKDFNVAGNVRKEVIVCGGTTYKNVMTFHGDSFETIVTATTGATVKTSTIKGKRIGECPAETRP